MPRTSRESASSVVRRQIRRVQLARISGETTPLGRWVARTRCTPRERPRWAMATRPGTNVGQLLGERGELVDHDDQPGERDVVRQGRDVRRRRCAARICSRRVELGAERAQRAGGGLAVQVGDQADRVRQRGRLGERGAALVVDQQEGAAVGRMAAARGRRSASAAARDLPGSGGAGDERVRALAAQVELHRARRPCVPASRRSAVPARSSSDPLTRSVRVRGAAPGGQIQQPDRRGGARRPTPPEPGRPGRVRASAPWRRGSRSTMHADAVGGARPAQDGDVPGLPGQPQHASHRERAASWAPRRVVRTSTPAVPGRPQRRGECGVERPVDDHDEPSAGGVAPPARGARCPVGSPSLGRAGRVQPGVQVVVGPALRRRGRPRRARRPAAGAAATAPTPSRASRSGSVSRSRSSRPARAGRRAGRRPLASTRERALPRARPPPAAAGPRRSTATGTCGGRHGTRVPSPSHPGHPRGPGPGADPDGERVARRAGARLHSRCAAAPRRRDERGEIGVRASVARDVGASTAAASAGLRGQDLRARAPRRRAGCSAAPTTVRRPGAQRHQRAEQGEEQERRRVQQPRHEHAADRGQRDRDPGQPSARRRRRADRGRRPRARRRGAHPRRPGGRAAARRARSPRWPSGRRGPATVSALAPSRRTAPVGQVRGRARRADARPSRLPLVEPRSATVIAPPPTSTVDVPPGHVGIVEPHAARRCPARSRACPGPSGTARPASGPPTTRSSRALEPRAGAPGARAVRGRGPRRGAARVR